MANSYAASIADLLTGGNTIWIIVLLVAGIVFAIIWLRKSMPSGYKRQRLDICCQYRRIKDLDLEVNLSMLSQERCNNLGIDRPLLAESCREVRSGVSELEGKHEMYKQHLPEGLTNGPGGDRGREIIGILSPPTLLGPGDEVINSVSVRESYLGRLYGWTCRKVMTLPCTAYLYWAFVDRKYIPKLVKRNDHYLGNLTGSLSQAQKDGLRRAAEQHV